MRTHTRGILKTIEILRGGKYDYFAEEDGNPQPRREALDQAARKRPRKEQADNLP
jgi:hypothetical protein